MSPAKKQPESILEEPLVDQLLVLCEEITRATPEGAKRFIEPAPGVLARAKSNQHHIVFGRRGSGKSSLLRKSVADLTIDRRPIAFVDMETFKGHSYPDVLISVLIKSLHEFQVWLRDTATTPATKKSFWNVFNAKPLRPPFSKTKTESLSDTLSLLIKDLEAQLTMPEKAEARKTQSTSNELTANVGGGVKTSVPGAEVSLSSSIGNKSGGSQEYSITYVSHKVEYLHQNILRFQRFFRQLSELSSGPSFLVLDDLYHIRKSDQAKVIDYFHRIAKGNNMWLKVGTIKHRSNWYQHSDPPIGMKLGDDAKEINLDMSLEKFETLKSFLSKVLSNIFAECAPLTVRSLLNPTAVDRLIIASGGVTRDFIGILAYAITQAKNRGPDHHRGPKIGAEDVNLATGDYDSIKREEFKLDADSDREALEIAFDDLVRFCTEKSKCNVFLISQALTGTIRDSIDQLIDLRLIHPVKSRVTLKTGAPGEIFEAYMLDLSQYTAARKVHQFQILDLHASNKDEMIRKAALIYPRPEKK